MENHWIKQSDETTEAKLQFQLLVLAKRREQADFKKWQCVKRAAGNPADYDRYFDQYQKADRELDSIADELDSFTYVDETGHRYINTKQEEHDHN